MTRHLLGEVLIASAIALSLLPPVLSPVRAEVLEPFQQVGDIRVYVGVMPAAIAQRHPSGHAEADMHGKASAKDMHVVVALFDGRGERIEDATVTARVLGPGHTSAYEIGLQPMKIADTITFGGFVQFESEGQQKLEIAIRRTGMQGTSVATFSFQPVTR